MPRRNSSAGIHYAQAQPELTRLRHELADAGYTPDALKRLLGITVLDDIGLLNHAPAVERIAGDRSAAATLTRLFFLEADEPRPHVAAAFSRQTLDAMVHGRILHMCAGAVRARVRIDPAGSQYYLADRRFRAFDPSALCLRGDDPVYPPSSDSMMLRAAIVAPDGGQILDLCTGSGVQGLMRADRAERVVAVDSNPRAAAIARFNAHLNHVENLEVRVGDLYAPVRGQSFDLILANPPFVPSPYATAASYHSGGPTGDRVLRRIIAGWRTHLRPGGRAFAISHVALRESTTLSDVAGGWFRDFPGRALILMVETGTPVDLAAAQALFALDRGLTAYAREVTRWVDYLRRQRINAVALLLIVAQRGRRRHVDVIAAQPRILPIPLSPPPADRIAAWLAR